MGWNYTRIDRTKRPVTRLHFSISWPVPVLGPVQSECCQKLLQISSSDYRGKKYTKGDVVIIALSESYSRKISQLEQSDMVVFDDCGLSFCLNFSNDLDFT